MRSRGYNKRFELYESTSVADTFGGFTNTTALLTEVKATATTNPIVTNNPLNISCFRVPQ